MAFNYFSHNGKILPIEEAQVPLSNIEYQYGFGVYESIKVSGGVAFFVADHIERLMSSAKEIGLTHPFSPRAVEQGVAELLEKNATESCNVKILLLGAKTAEGASLEILCLNPLFPDAKLYRDGVHCVTYEYERAFPHAKTLNMLQSYLAYAEARLASAYDALLLDREGNITEGTRTNFFCMKGKTITSPPKEKILLGVTRKAVLKVAKENDFTVEERNIRPANLSEYDGAFLTSTSSKIMSIHSINEHTFAEQPKALKELMTAFSRFLDESRGVMN